jgi:hypothetical protein
MAFDHLRILQDGVERARAKLEYTTLGAAFCRDTFTVAELRRVYEIVWGTPLDPRNFHRKVTGADRFLVETGSASSSGGRPAQLYRRGDTDVLHPPMLRPRQRQACEPVRQSPGGPVDVGTGDQRRWYGAERGRYSADTAAGVQASSALEDDDVHADATVPADT